MSRLKHVDIQTKIILVLIGVIVPTFILMALVQSKVSEPILKQEMRQIGIAAAESLSSQILTNGWLSRSETYPNIEREVQEALYLQPSIIRLDVYAMDANDVWRIIASNIEGETGALVTTVPPLDSVASEYKEEDDLTFWEISLPIEGKNKSRVLGIVHIMVSTRTVQRLAETYFRISVMAAAASTVILIIVLSFFLRRAVTNERLLRRVESANVELSEQLHETQRELMNIEKLAVMGQLTANFAHEIGTPLNAISGHLQLMDDELRQTKTGDRTKERLEILRGEVTRIEQIVKGFLQTAAKPPSQKQLVDLNKLVDKTIDLVRPRMDSLGVQIKTSWDHKIGPLRVVATDIEQILINLLNNSLDSLKERKHSDPDSKLEVKVSSDVERRQGKEWVKISLYDTGLGIKKENLPKIKKPFFTTKRPGEGTGLGLAICHELASRYGGVLEVDSKEGAWTKVMLKMPYGTNV